MRTGSILALLAFAMPVLAQDRPADTPAKVEMTTPAFELFRLAPGKQEAFIRDMAVWDQVNIAGGQPPTQLFLHANGEGWDVLLYKPARPRPKRAQEAAMAAKISELGLPTGALYFVSVREMIADHTHLEMAGPTTAAQWLAELEGLRAAKLKR